MLPQHAPNINRENLPAVHLQLLVLPCPVSLTAFPVAFCSTLSLSEQVFLQLQLFTKNILSCGVNLWNSLRNKVMSKHHPV